jgi:hypothetical protein
MLPTTKFVYQYLLRHGPSEMRVIMAKALAKFPFTQHRTIWNAIHNGCACPTEFPRFRKFKENGKTLFDVNAPVKKLRT